MNLFDFSDVKVAAVSSGVECNECGCSVPKLTILPLYTGAATAYGACGCVYTLWVWDGTGKVSRVRPDWGPK